jgi:hypothetical protein
MVSPYFLTLFEISIPPCVDHGRDSRCKVFGRVYATLKSSKVSPQSSKMHVMHSYNIVLIQYSN